MNKVHDSLAGAGSSSKLLSAERCLATSSIPGVGLSAFRLGSGRLPRLLKRAEFVAASSGRRVHSSRMTVQILERRSTLQAGPDSPRGPRFGLTVTKKTANAVGRNRIRRRLRALIGQLKPFWPDADIDFVIIGRAEMLTADIDVIASDLKRAFSSSPKKSTPTGQSSQSHHHGRGKGSTHFSKAAKLNPTD